jgi:hypothetical protein
MELVSLYRQPARGRDALKPCLCTKEKVLRGMVRYTFTILNLYVELI